jgi:hypothetical protein
MAAKVRKLTVAAPCKADIDPEGHPREVELKPANPMPLPFWIVYDMPGEVEIITQAIVLSSWALKRRMDGIVGTMPQYVTIADDHVFIYTPRSRVNAPLISMSCGSLYDATMSPLPCWHHSHDHGFLVGDIKSTDIVSKGSSIEIIQADIACFCVDCDAYMLGCAVRTYETESHSAAGLIIRRDSPVLEKFGLPPLQTMDYLDKEIGDGTGRMSMDFSYWITTEIGNYKTKPMMDRLDEKEYRHIVYL